jgi:hypothetical protein
VSMRLLFRVREREILRLLRVTSIRTRQLQWTRNVLTGSREYHASWPVLSQAACMRLLVQYYYSSGYCYSDRAPVREREHAQAVVICLPRLRAGNSGPAQPGTDVITTCLV